MPVDSYGNEIWEQQELFPCSWGVNSGFKHLQEKLDCLVPLQGMCEFPRTKNKNLEKFRHDRTLPMTFSTMDFIIGNHCSKRFSDLHLTLIMRVQ